MRRGLLGLALTLRGFRTGTGGGLFLGELRGLGGFFGLARGLRGTLGLGGGGGHVGGSLRGGGFLLGLLHVGRAAATRRLDRLLGGGFGRRFGLGRGGSLLLGGGLLLRCRLGLVARGGLLLRRGLLLGRCLLGDGRLGARALLALPADAGARDLIVRQGRRRVPHGDVHRAKEVQRLVGADPEFCCQITNPNLAQTRLR